MNGHQALSTYTVGSYGAADASPDSSHALNVRVLRFRHSPHREDPTLLAQELLDAGRNADALELLETALAREPGDADLELLRGRALLGTGDVSRAKETLIRAAKAAPGWAAPFTWLTRALSIGGDTSRAGAIASRAKSLGADDTQVVRLANGYETRERLDMRLARYEESPENEEPVMLARELALGGREADASRVLRSALERDGDDPDTLAALAQLTRADGRHEEAIALLRRARSAAPGWDTVERALHSLVGEEVLVDMLYESPIVPTVSAAPQPEHERAVSVFDLDITVEPLVSAKPAAADLDGALDALLALRRDTTVPYATEGRDTEHGLPAIDATLVGMPAPVRETIHSSTVKHDLAHGRIRRAGATGWPRRVVPKAEPAATPYVRVLVGEPGPRFARA